MKLKLRPYASWVRELADANKSRHGRKLLRDRGSLSLSLFFLSGGGDVEELNVHSPE